MDEWRTGKPSVYDKYIVNSKDHGVCFERFAADNHWWYGSELSPDESVKAWMMPPDSSYGICYRCCAPTASWYRYCPMCGVKLEENLD